VPQVILELFILGKNLLKDSLTLFHKFISHQKIVRLSLPPKLGLLKNAVILIINR